MRRPDVVVANTVQSLLHLSVPCRLRRISLVSVVRDLGEGGNRSKAAVTMYRLLVRMFARAVVFNSEMTRLSWKISVPSRVIRTAVPDPYFSATWVAPPVSTFVMVGRIAPWKGQDDVVEAISAMRAEGEEVELILVGAETFGETERGSDTRPYVHQTGFVSSPWTYMSNATAVIHASRTPEPLGQVVCQAAAVGAPVVCADKGGQMEWLHDGETCLTFEAGNVDSLVRALRKAMRHPMETAAMAHRAHDAAQDFRTERAYMGLREWVLVHGVGREQNLDVG
ncbi:glycosyltransferase family 4 protein [Demequina sp. NBRC 110051]|uniref:glycosyltransferase family 4 protein n=1 Tax=Demequina sp. NBRC 110051 TaxID=1570340 RepID=UPI0013563144|nr:glycosyltransferase family 4 protein [Demequina sp. NBRC 110051]